MTALNLVYTISFQMFEMLRNQLIAVGRDIERRVLTKAVRSYCEDSY